MTRQNHILTRWLAALRRPVAAFFILLLAQLALGTGSVQAQVGSDFDHSSTGFQISGPHNMVRCETCHVKGVFKGTPRDCNSCHGWANPRSSVTKSIQHIPASTRCEQCHMPEAASFNDALLTYTHPDVMAGTCNNCHGGQYPVVRAAPKDATHTAAAASGLTCDVCHNVGSFQGGGTGQPGFTKQAIPSAAGFAHIPIASGATCTSCHVNPDFSVMPSITDIHANIQSTSTNCVQCHSASAAAKYSSATMVPAIVAPPSNHIPMGTQSCETCHVGNGSSIATTPVVAGNHFSGSLFSHAGITSGCVNCHGPNVNASGYYGINSIVLMPSTNGPSASAHIPSSTACETCHLPSIAAMPAMLAPQISGSHYFQTPPPTPGMIHTGITSGCSACHDTGAVWLGVGLYTVNTSTYTGFLSRPIAGGNPPYAVADAGHPMSGDCSQCHAGISFNPNAVAKPSNHIPTSAGCVSCHSASYASYAVMPTVTDIHANVASNSCAQCHSVANANFYNQMPTMNPAIVAPPSDHIDMGTLGCEGCHVGGSSSISGPVINGARFSSSAFSHNGLTKSCSFCHAPGAGSFKGVVPKSTNLLTPAHVPYSPTTGCEVCHSNLMPISGAQVPTNGAASPISFANAGFSHIAATTGCVNCHGPTITNTSFYGLSSIVVMPPSASYGATSHLPTSTTCENCHTAPGGLVTTITPAPGSGFKTPAPSNAQIHAGVTGNCSSCHDTNYTWMSVYPAYAISTSAPFTGFQTRPQLTSGQLFVADSAHPTTGDCSQCHGNFVDFTGPSKPANHIPTSAACVNCHTSTDYSVMPSLESIHANAQSTTTGCAQCHSAANAAIYNQMVSMQPQIVAPPGTHIDMGTVGCETCHVGAGSSLTLPVQTGARFTNSAFNHTGMVKTCSDCHGASVTSTSFFGVYPMTIGRLSPIHVPIPTTQACNVCHTTTPLGLVPSAGGGTAYNFGNTKYIHTGITTGCAACHDTNSQTYYGLSNTVLMPATSPMGATSHIPSSNVCENCHAVPSGFINTVGTAPGSAFALNPPSTAQIHNGITGNCSNCHDTGYVWMSMAPAYNITTSAPYTGFQTRPQPSSSGQFFVADAGHPTSGDCSQCHGSFLDFTGVSKPANHIPVSSSSQCTSCHTSSNYAVMPLRSLIHQWAPNSSTNCAQCHSAANAAIYALPTLNITAPASNHIDMGGLGCEACHTASVPVGDATTFAGSYFSHAGSNIAGNCAACHDQSVTAGTFQGNSGSFRPKTNDLTPGHIPILAPVDCSVCHVNSMPTMPIPASGATSGMTTFANSKYSHSGVTGGCAQCHGDGVVANGSPTGGTFYGITAIVRAQMGANASTWGPTVHLPTSTVCENCHMGSVPAGVVAGNATNAANSSGFATSAPTPTQIHMGITGGCSNCHDTNMVWMGMSPAYNITTAAPYKGFQTRPQHGVSGQFYVRDDNHVTTGDCSNCHGGFVDFTAPSKPSNHIPTASSAACTTCHTSPDYSQMPFLVNIHANAPSTTTNCAVCHSAANATTYAMSSMSPALVGVPSGHMDQGTLSCEQCHVAPGSGVSLPVQNGAHFTNSGFSHTGFTANCGECHGVFSSAGVAGAAPTFTGAAITTPRTIKSASGLSSAHVPTTLDCVACHTNVPNAIIPFASSAFTFAAGKFSHTSNPKACADCHSTGATAYYGVSIVQIAIPAPGVVAATTTHMPTGSTCETCHASSVPSSLVAATGTMPAIGATGFRVQPPASATIHSNTPAVCSNCHERAMTWAGANLYPITTAAPYTGFQTRPTPSPIPTNGFTVLDAVHPATGECSACHASMANFTATAKPSNHIPTTASCTNCHTNADYSIMPQANWDLIHANTPTPGSNCAQCHSSTNAAAYSNSVMTIKPPTGDHMSMGTLDCASCHTTTHGGGSFSSFSNASFLHSGLTVACSICHSTVSGSQITFSGTTPSLPKIAPATHVPNPSSLDCGACHTTPSVSIPFGNAGNVASFASGKFSHSGITTQCATCHQGTTGSSYYGIPAIVSLPATLLTTAGTNNHIPVSTTCESCHLATVPATAMAMPSSVALGSSLFKTPAPSSSQIHSGISSNCAGCHEAGMVWLDTNVYLPSSTTFTSGGVYTGFIVRPATTQNVNNNGVVDPTPHPTQAAGDCSKCHGSTLDFSITAKPSNHIPYASGVTCITCHTQMGNTNDFSIPPTYDVIHANAQSTSTNCAQCHSSTNAPTFAIPSASFSIKAPSAGHVPLAGVATCETCHYGTGTSVTSYTAITNSSNFNTAMYSHSGITTGCVTCHGTGISGSSFTNIPAIVAIPASTNVQGSSNHIPYGTTPCETCHLSNVPGSMALPSSVTVGSGTTQFKLALSTASNAAVHTGITSGCAACHEKNYVWLGMSQASYTPSSVATGAAAYTGFLTRPYGSPTTTPYAVIDLAHAQSSLATADCSQCHGGTSSFSAAAQPAGHMPTTNASCANCHPTAGDYSQATLVTPATLHPLIPVTVATTLTKLSAVAAVTNTSCIACHAAYTAGTANRAPFAGCTTQAACTSPPQVTYQPKTTAGVALHVPIGTLDCSACHISGSTFASTKMGSTGHSNAKIGGLQCQSCHELGMSWTNVTGFQVRPSATSTTQTKHSGSKAAPNDCAGCHSYSSGGFRGLRLPTMRNTTVNPDINRLRPTGQNALTSRGMLGNSFNHQGVEPAKCKTCHDGKNASGMPARHLMVSTSCDTCHRTTAWLPAQFSHNGVSPNTCMMCHNGISATTKPTGHFMTARSCDSCHKQFAWTPVSYSHLSPSYQGGSSALTCVSCHITNSEIIPRQMRGVVRSKPTPLGP